MAQIDANELAWNDNEYFLDPGFYCSPNLTTSQNGLVFKHGPADFQQDSNTVIGNLPIHLDPDVEIPTVAFYFEMDILQIRGLGGISIGFCDNGFPEEGELIGLGDNSIGIYDNDGIFFDDLHDEYSDVEVDEIENDSGYFEEEEVIGIGLINHPNSKLECFATRNGKLYDKLQLPDRYMDPELIFYPAVTLSCQGDAIQVNFARNKWTFNDFEGLLEGSISVNYGQDPYEEDNSHSEDEED